MFSKIAWLVYKEKITQLINYPFRFTIENLYLIAYESKPNVDRRTNYFDITTVLAKYYKINNTA